MKEHPHYKGYFISEGGKVYSNHYNPVNNPNKKLLEKKTSLNKGYLYVRLQYNGRDIYRGVHRLIAETFIPNPNNLMQVNHINEIKTDNRVENLEWCDCQYNNEFSKSKYYQIITPKGEILQIYNLNKYCRENNLDSGHMHKVANGKSKQHKGYKAILLNSRSHMRRNENPVHH